MVSWINFSARLLVRTDSFSRSLFFVGQLGIDSIFHLLLVGFDLYILLYLVAFAFSL